LKTVQSYDIISTINKLFWGINMNSKSLNILNIFAMILLVALCVANVVVMLQAGEASMNTVYSIGIVLTGIFAVYYILAGCKKIGGKGYFKCFLLLYAIVSLFPAVIGICGEPVGVFGIVSYIVTAVPLFVLAFGLDLGKKKSLILGGIVVVSVVCRVIFTLCAGLFSDFMFEILSDLLLSLNLILMIFSKYDDKASRGSK